jgi:hypothetical protein
MRLARKRLLERSLVRRLIGPLGYHHTGVATPLGAGVTHGFRRSVYTLPLTMIQGFGARYKAPFQRHSASAPISRNRVASTSQASHIDGSG